MQSRSKSLAKTLITLGLSAICILPTTPVLAKPEVPVPPAYVMDKQLEGEDPFDIVKPVFSPDSAYVAAFMHSSHELVIWDSKTGKVAAKWEESSHGYDAIDGLEFSNDGKQLIVLRAKLPMKFIDWSSGKVVKEIALEADPKKILSYAFSPAQDLLAVGTYDGIALWDVKASKKIKDFQKGQAISGLDMIITKDSKGRPIRLLSYGRAVLPPDLKWQNLAGLINIDSGSVTPLLNDIPANKKVEGSMTFFYSDFEWGAGHVLVTYSTFPPKTKAGVYLVDTWTGKYVSQQDLGQFVVKYKNRYLGKPYYGFVIATADMSNANAPYGITTQYLVPTNKSIEVRDTVDQDKMATAGLRFANSHGWAAVTTKKDQASPCQLFIYKVVPKK